LLGYDGWFGRPIVRRISGSTCVGRGTQYVYFVSWQAMNASTPTMLTMARIRADSGSLRPWAEMALRATSFQRPAAYAPVTVSQYWAIRSCSLVVERLAHHAVRGEVWDKALTYLREAGTKALMRSANAEAIAYFTQGLDLVQKLPATRERMRQEMELLLALGQAHQAAKGLAASEAERAYARARDLAEQLGQRGWRHHVLREPVVAALGVQDNEMAPLPPGQVGQPLDTDRLTGTGRADQQGGQAELPGRRDDQAAALPGRQVAAQRGPQRVGVRPGRLPAGEPLRPAVGAVLVALAAALFGALELGRDNAGWPAVHARGQQPHRDR